MLVRFPSGSALTAVAFLRPWLSLQDIRFFSAIPAKPRPVRFHWNRWLIAAIRKHGEREQVVRSKFAGVDFWMKRHILGGGWIIVWLLLRLQGIQFLCLLDLQTSLGLPLEPSAQYLHPLPHTHELTSSKSEDPASGVGGLRIRAKSWIMAGLAHRHPPESQQRFQQWRRVRLAG